MVATRSKVRAATYRVYARTATAIVFGLMVFGTAIASLAGVSVDIGVSENRTLATVQPATPRNLLDRNYFQTVNNWANDHQALRAPLVALTSATKLYAFNAPLNDKTLIGRDGFYFYGLRSMQRDFERRDRFENNPAYVREVLSLLRGLEAWSAHTGRRVLFMVAPNKHNVYPDKYNPKYTRGTGPGTGETLEKWLAQAMPAMAVPVGDELRQAARERIVYYRTDTHWNPWGAKIAAAQTVERLRTIAPILPVAPAASEWIDKPETTSAGDFADLLSLPIEETVLRPEPVGGLKAIDDPELSARLMPLLPDSTRLFKVRRNPSAVGAPKLLVLGDSFMSALVPYLAEQFSASVFYNRHGGPNTVAHRFPQDLIEAFDPDVVLIEIVERRVRPCGAHKNRRIKCIDWLLGDMAGNMLDMRLATLARAASVVAENIAPRVSGNTWTIDTRAPLPEGRQIMLRARGMTKFSGLKLAEQSTPQELRGTYSGLDISDARTERLYLVRPDQKTATVTFNAAQALDPTAVLFDVLSVPDDTNPEAITAASTAARQISSHTQ